MQTKTRKDMVFGVVVLAIGAAYLVLTAQLPRADGIDSATVPYFLSTLMIVLGVVQIAGAARAGRTTPAPDATAATAAKKDYRTVFITALLIFIYVALLDYIGFMVMSALYLFVQISFLTPKHTKANYAAYAVVAVATAVIVYFLFFWAFDIMLPHGELWYDLGIHMDWMPFE